MAEFRFTDSVPATLFFAIALALFAASSLEAQVDRMMDTIATDVKVDQQLEQQVDLSLPFIDEEGKTVLLGEFFGEGKPVILTLVYYGCPMMCGQILEGTTRSIKETGLEIDRDFEVVTISFDHTEGPDLAVRKKNTFKLRMRREGTEEGWHFLTSDSGSVAALAKQVGFKYFRDEESGQYGHSSTIIVLTPTGAVSRYFFGVDYDPTDLRLGLIEASEEKIGSIADELLLLCFQYNPMTGKYAPAIANLLKVLGILFVGILVSFIIRSLRSERQQGPKVSTESA